MKNRGLVTMAAVVAALGGYLAWDLRAEKADIAKKEAETRLFPLPADQVSELTIENPRQTTKLVKTIDGWKLESPYKDNADDAFVDDFVERSVKDRYLEVAKEGDGIDWKIYGLDNPIGKITLKSQTGESRTLEVSMKQNFEQNAIARRTGENKVLIVPFGWSAHAGRGPLEFRDKRLFRHKIGGVDRVDFKNAHGAFSLERKDGHWSMVDRAWTLDENRVRELLSMISETKAMDFVQESAPDTKARKASGLAPAAITLRLKMADKEWTAEMGRAEKSEFALTSDPVFLLKLDAGALAKFEAITAAQYRDRRAPFEFDKAAVHKIVLETPLKTSAFMKASGGGWELEGKNPEIAIDVTRVSSLVNLVRDSEAAAFAEVPKTVFKPVNHLRFLNATGEPVFEVEWAAPRKEKIEGQSAETIVAKTSHEKDLLSLDTATVQNWALDQLVKPVASPANSAAGEGDAKTTVAPTVEKKEGP